MGRTSAGACLATRRSPTSVRPPVDVYSIVQAAQNGGFTLRPVEGSDTFCNLGGTLAAFSCRVAACPRADARRRAASREGLAPGAVLRRIFCDCATNLAPGAESSPWD